MKNAATKQLLETVGASFLTGYGHAAQARDVAEAESALEALPTRFKGFAYEGAAMGFAIRDGLPGGRHDWVTRLLAARDEHVYMAYVGVGWAMARLPRFRWHTLTAPDPLLRWLVLDGYGFHQAYFKTRQYVHGHYRRQPFGWPADGPHWYADRVIDQGIGRASWFVGGADVDRVAALIRAFPAARHPDLWAGAGLAATYAGGVDEAELQRFRTLAGEHAVQVAQGSAFAAGARVRANLVVPHTETATAVFCGMTPIQAAKVTDETLPDPSATGPLPAYEVWRQAIAGELAGNRGC